VKNAAYRPISPGGRRIIQTIFRVNVGDQEAAGAISQILECFGLRSGLPRISPAPPDREVFS
jgi:hypothetical protein